MTTHVVCFIGYTKVYPNLEDTTDYETIEIFPPLEEISNLKDRKSPPEGEKSFLAVVMVIKYQLLCRLEWL